MEQVAQAPRRTSPPPVALDDLSVLLRDWRTHLRARNVAPSTIASYLRVGEALHDYLVEHGMPTTVTGLSPNHSKRSWPR